MMPKYKGKEINTRPTDGMVSEAKKGLAWRKEHGRGGTEVGVARARDIQNRKELSFDTVKRMHSFFARHEVDKKAEGFKPGEEGYPSAGRIAWALWGGDAGFSWSRRIAGQIDDDRSEEAVNMDNEVEVEEVVVSADEERSVEVAEEAVEGAVEESVENAEVIEERQVVEVQHRAMEMDMSPINEDKRTVSIAISSEEPVERSFGKEILDHTENSIDLSFLASGRAPLLLDHDPEKQIGVVESVELDGKSRRLRAKVRFGKGELAREAFSDVVDGIKANISVGYSISKMDRDRNDKNTYRATSWKPVEASLVSIPADMTVGVGRSSEPSQKPVIKTSFVEENTMSEVDIEAVKAEAQQSAQRNAAQIVELGSRHKQGEMARKAIAEGRSIEEFRGELLEKIGSQRALEDQEVGMTRQEVKKFSLARAVNALANPTDRRAQEAAAFEFECSRAAADQYGTTAQGIMLPAEVLRTWKRDMNSGDDSALFSDDFRGGDFIDALRNQSSVMQAGARMLGGLSGDVKIPKKTAASTAAWISTEGGDASESEMTVGQVSLTPKTLGAFTDVTRQLLIQSSLDVEGLIRDDLSRALAIAIDKAGLEGTGASGQPTGILSTSGVNTVANFAGANPTFAEVVSLETAVAEDNALQGNLAYIMPASMYGALKTTEKASGTAQFVVEPGGSINGYRGIVSNQATSGNLYFGNFDDLLIGMFGGLDLTVDPYTMSKSGTIRLVALQSVDMAVRHAVSFAFGNDGA
ncbi:MAG: phage major capsid protein [Euryarchaeota archaeon]|nr:phage major capsid protein [Euryarchaeota archaeon]